MHFLQDENNMRRIGIILFSIITMIVRVFFVVFCLVGEGTGKFFCALWIFIFMYVYLYISLLCTSGGVEYFPRIFFFFFSVAGFFG